MVVQLVLVIVGMWVVVVVRGLLGCAVLLRVGGVLRGRVRHARGGGGVAPAEDALPGMAVPVCHCGFGLSGFVFFAWLGRNGELLWDLGGGGVWKYV